MQRWVEVLGDPHLAAPAIHVTGTNGKGSVVRMLSAVLRANGVLTGSYTSPHLETVRERIAIAGESISEDDFALLMSEMALLEPVVDVETSYFTLLTAAAFAHFASEAVEAMLVEVGLLGRFDTTNVVPAEVAVITNVGRDHTDGIGDWQERIAGEKAGIIKPGSHVICGETEPDLVAIFEAEADGGREFWLRDRDFAVEHDQMALGGHLVTLRTPYAGRTEVHIPAHGDHQADNALVALAAAEAFFGRALHPDVVADGFAALHIPGRFEVVSHSPLVVIDVAHNAEGLTATAETFADEFTVLGRSVAIVGLLAGRDAGAAVAAVARSGVDRLVAVRADSPRAVDPREVAALARAAGMESEVIDDPAVAFRTTLDRMSDDDALLVTGSFYVAGTVRATARLLGLLEVDA